MLTLALLRHAKSSWDDPKLSDFDRPLNDRGRAAAPDVGRSMAGLNLAPDLVLCSPARRTRETLELIVPELPRPPGAIQFDAALYDAMPERMLKVIRSVSEAVTTLLLVGHNPGMHALAASLPGRGDQDLRARVLTRYPTAALAVIDFETDNWAKVAPGLGQLRAFIIPAGRA